MVYRTTYKLEVGKKRALPLKGRKGTDEIKDLKIDKRFPDIFENTHFQHSKRLKTLKIPDWNYQANG